jgi:hypothetical protein
MPCGGIYTVKPLTENKEWFDSYIYCSKFELNGKTPDHYVEEWDGFMLHGECVLKWLVESEEGQCVNLHLHEVQVDGKVVYAEGQERPIAPPPAGST